MFTIICYFIVALIIVALIAYLRLDEAPAKADEFHLTDYTYRDDRGNLYVVTSADITDNWSLLIEEYGLSAAYISKHVFLVDAKPAI